MSLTSTMFTGVSGLLNQAEGMNVIGNNISNVNTIGFKGARTLFSDMLSTPTVNESQIGHGVQIQKIDNLFTQGSFEPTGNVTDLAMQGNSFFAVKDPNVTGTVTQNNAMLTRAGAFRLDSDLNLVNPDGYLVLDTAGNPIKFNDNAAAITAATAALIPAATTAAAINTQAAAQLTAAGTFTTAVYTAAGTAYNTQAGTVTTAATTLAATAGLTAAELTAAGLISAAATAYQAAATTANTTHTAAAVAAAQTAFANLSTVTTNNASVFVSTPTITAAYNTFNSALSSADTQNSTDAPPAQITAANAIDTAATAAQTAATAAVTTPSAATNAAAQTAFNALNTLTNGSTFTIPAAVTTAYTTFRTGLNTANTTVNTAMTNSATAAATLAKANSLAFSKITSIDPSGLITYLGKDGATTNYYNTSGMVGVTANAANAASVQRLAIITVANPGGLEKAGGTLYKPTSASGVPSTAFSLLANSANGSNEKIFSNSLEQSNVDMATEFVKMILTQRAYSANSKTITTSDEMTQEVINLKR